MKAFTVLISTYVILGSFLSTAQTNYWQQRVEYTMDIDFDVDSHQFSGRQRLVYHNNSPDTLFKVFYHLYFNAFQPGSAMDVRSRTYANPDGRIADRIAHLKENEMGYHKIKNLRQEGKALDYHIEGTVLEVQLAQPIPPNTITTFEMEFESQVPIQIRRSGRDNAGGIDYSMSQWYPKMAEYDEMGWHADPYVMWEFYGVWGDFNVNITIDSSYMIAATGILQNPMEIGFGYTEERLLKQKKGNTLTWKWTAENVHDFVWAADRDYMHDILKLESGPDIHLYYTDKKDSSEWKDLQAIIPEVFEFVQNTFGEYPYPKYSIIQGGDGGTEYPMATLITGNRSLRSLTRTFVHEVIHSWFHGTIATNESSYAWMDEGFTSYASTITQRYIYKPKDTGNPLSSAYSAYFSIAKLDDEEPLTTHADHFEHLRSYSISTYSKGSIWLHQLSYILGDEVFFRGMKRYYDEWKFKHPKPNDFMRIMEKESRLELDWYYEYFVNTTNTIDYGIKSVVGLGKNTTVVLQKVGRMPMPIEIHVEYEDGGKEILYIPLAIMRGEKKPEYDEIGMTVYSDWPWTHSYYTLTLPVNATKIKSLEIDASERMADIDRSNNLYPFNTSLGVDGKEIKK